MAFDETDDTVIVVDDLDIYKVPKSLTVTAAAASAAAATEKTEEEKEEERSRRALRKYVSQSQSLQNLRQSASVKRGIKNFDHPQKQ